MKETPLISVITPVFNSVNFIVEAINSVRNQSYLNWEMVITDDHSDDKTVEIIERLMIEDSRIKLFKLDVNLGAGVARNTSILNSKGDFIAFLDSDDQWLPTKLEEQVKFMIKNKYTFSFTSYLPMKENGTETNRVVISREKVSMRDMRMTNYIGCSTAMYNVEVIGKKYMPEIRKRQDYGLWIDLISETGFAYGLKEALTKYRVRENSVSSNKVLLIKWMWNFYREVLLMSRIRAFLAVCTWGFLNVSGLKNKGIGL